MTNLIDFDPFSQNPDSYASTWWEHTGSPRELKTNLHRALRLKKSVLLSSTTPIPWLDDLLTSESYRIRLETPNFSLYPIDQQPESFHWFLDLLPQNIKCRYRPGIPPEEFIANYDSDFHYQHFLIKLDQRQSAPALLQSISTYLKLRDRKQHAVFVVISQFPWKNRGIPDGFEYFDLDNLPNYSFRSCISAMTSILDFPEPVQNYLSELLVALCGRNLETAASLLETPEELLLKPETSILNLPKSEIRSLRFSSSYAVTNQIWTAQIRTIYPIIEKKRIEMIQKYKNDLPRYLTWANGFTEDMSIYDAEIGFLNFLSFNTDFPIEPNDALLLKLLTQARNDLSHLKYIDGTLVRQLLNQ